MIKSITKSLPTAASTPSIVAPMN
jgi:hypothetical protein